MKKESLDQQIENIRKQQIRDIQDPPAPNIRFESPEFTEGQFDAHMENIKGKEAVTIFQFPTAQTYSVRHRKGWTIESFKERLRNVFEYAIIRKIEAGDDTFIVMTDSVELLTKQFMEKNETNDTKATIRLFKFLEKTAMPEPKDYNEDLVL